MFPNLPNRPIDILDYVPSDRGYPVWVFFDLDKCDITPGTKTVSIYHQDGDNHPPNQGEITCFEEHVRVLGNEYTEFVRLEHWPSNLFIQMASGHAEYDVLDSEIDINGWVCDRIEVFLGGWEVPSVPFFQNPPIIWDTNNHSANRYFSISDQYTWDNPIHGNRLIEMVDTGGQFEVPKWVFFRTPAPHVIDVADDISMIHFYSSGDHSFGYGFNHEGPVEDGHERLSYFRRNWWPAGVYRLAELYYTDSVEANDVVQIPIFSDEPNRDDAERMVFGMLPYPTITQYRDRVTLEYPIISGTADFDIAQLNNSRCPWVYWKPDGDSNTEKQRCIHISPDRVVERDSEEITRSETEGALSLYRFEYWPHNVWASSWKFNEDDVSVPVFEESSFGRVCGREDETSPDNPIRLEAQFDFQKWVSPEWDSRTWSTSGDGYIHVSISNSRWYAEPRQSRANYHIAGWRTTRRLPEATYYRRAAFPTGVWRRVDRFEDTLTRRYDVTSARMIVKRHNDEPGQPDCEGPWYSARVRDWVTRVSEKLGRPIFSDPSQGTPWLKFWTPQQAESITSSISPVIGGHRIYLPVGELPRIRGQARGTSIYDDHRDYHYARRYRGGVAIACNPCEVRWSDPEREGVERPEHPLDHILYQFEEWFIGYHDPDVVEDMVDDVFEKFKIKTRAFTEQIATEQRRIRDMHGRIEVSARKIASLHEQESYYSLMTKGRFRKTLEANRNMISNLGTLMLDGDQLSLVMNQFEIEGQMIGPLVIHMTISGSTYPVTVSSQANQSQYGNPHPHVDTDGRVCWGRGQNLAAQFSVGADPLEFMFWAAEQMRINYRADDAYCKIDNWTRKEVWWCDHCETEHPNGQECPHYCPACDLHVDMDDHQTCAEHGCWNTLQHDGCPACEEQRNAAQEDTEEDDAASAAE